MPHEPCCWWCDASATSRRKLVRDQHTAALFHRVCLQEHDREQRSTSAAVTRRPRPLLPPLRGAALLKHQLPSIAGAVRPKAVRETVATADMKRLLRAATQEEMF